jgi:hypothetical protein
MKRFAGTSIALLAVLALAVSAWAAEKTYTVSMSGKAETPKGDPNGRGTARIKIEASRGELCFALSWTAIGTPVAAHIHKGRKGVAGPVVIPLFGGTPKHKGCVKASKTLLSKINRNPAGYYVNVHTQAFPAGAVRAQL